MAPKNPPKSSAHACNRCRAAKLRCLVDTIGEHGKCRRCYNGDKECVFNDLAARSRRERLDTRVRCLEQEVQFLRAHIGSSPPDPEVVSSRTPKPASGPPTLSSNDSPMQHSAHSPNADNRRGSSPNEHSSSLETGFPYATIPPQQFEHLFKVFVNHSLPQYPILALERNATAYTVSQAKPVLSFAMVTAAARASDPVLFRQLHVQLSRLLAEKIVVCGERTVELLQALLIAEVWYDPPDDLNRLNFYLLLQIAASMAQQLGLWWDTKVIDAITNNKAHIDQLESWRIAIAVYLASSTVSVSLQRPVSVSLPAPTRAALAKYTINATHVNDKVLAAWMTLQLMSEEIEDLRVKIGYHDGVSSNLEKALRDLDGRLALYEQVSALNEALRVQYFYVRCKFYELDVTYYTLFVPQEINSHTYSKGVNRISHERATLQLVRSCHNMIDTLLRMVTNEYLHCPTVTTVRALYALRTLLLLHHRYPNLEISGASISLRDLIDFEGYMNRLEKFLDTAKGPLEHRVPVMASKIMQNIWRREAQSFTLACPIPINQSQTTSNDLETVTSSTLYVGQNHRNQAVDIHPGGCTNYSTPGTRHTQEDSSDTQPIVNSIESDQSSSSGNLPQLDAAFWGMFNAQIGSSLDCVWNTEL